MLEDTDLRRVRSHQFVCHKWTLFTISLMILIGCATVAALSHNIADNYAINYHNQFNSEYQKEALEQALIGMAVVTGCFALFGLMAALREHYCASLTFAVYMTVNTVGSVYGAVQDADLWLYALINLTISVIAFTYARQLRTQRRLTSSSSAFVIASAHPYPNQPICVPIVAGGQQWTTGVPSPVGHHWHSQQPPLYSHEYGGYYDKNKQFI